MQGVSSYSYPWKGVHNLDNGGPLATARAGEILGRLADAGVSGCRIDGMNSFACAAWLSPIFAASGLLRVVDLGWGSMWKADGVIPGDMDVLHTGQTGWGLGDTKYFCPYSRSGTWDRWANHVAKMVALWNPEQLWLDQEIFTSHPSTEQWIASCNRCGTWQSYNAGRLQFVADTRLIADRVAKRRLPLYCYLAREEVGNWWPVGTGDGPGQAFYWRYKKPGETRCAGALAAEILEQEDVTCGLVYVSPWWDMANKTKGMPSEYELCCALDLILKAGAHGANFYPGYCKDNIDPNASENVGILKLMKAAAEIMAGG